MELQEVGSKVRKKDNSESGDFVIVKKSSNSTTAQDSDTSFEELQQNVEDKADKERTETESSDPFESMVIVNNAIDKDGLDISREKTADLVALRTAISVDLSPDTIIVEQKENHMIEGEADISCHDNVRQVLDDIEAQIERMR